MSLLKHVAGRLRMLRPRSREEIHAYWQAPDHENLAEGYLEGAERSRYLVGVLERHVGKDASVLEIGCNVGRNLHFLLEAGWRDVAGVEISEQAVELMKQAFPDVAERAAIHVGPVEEHLKRFGDGQFDVVFTMAVLEHIHPESEWIFPEMVRVAGKRLVVLEDEVSRTWRHWPRNYREIFEGAGARQVEELDLSDIPGLGEKFVGRVIDVG